MAGLLPVQHYLVTFTVPAALRMVVRANGRVCYGALFDCGAQALVELASGKRFIGSDQNGFLRSVAHVGPRLHRLQSACALRGARWGCFAGRIEMDVRAREFSVSAEGGGQGLSRQIP